MNEHRVYLHPATKFRRLLAAPGLLTLPGIYDCLTARLAEQAGFQALFTSGFGISATLLGKPDYGLLTATETLTVAGNICRTVDIPVVADLDTGYGNALNVYRTVSEACSLGVAGVILEDQQWPKRCGHFEGKRVIPLEEHVQKIQAAIEARGDSDLVIIGRTDARAAEGLDRAIKRGRAYQDAGADIIFVEAPQSRAELDVISEAFPDVHTFANMIEGGRTPLLSYSELEELGFKIVVYPLTALFSATFSIQKAFAHLVKHGSTEGLDLPFDFEAFERVVDVPFLRDLDERFTKTRKS